MSSRAFFLALVIAGLARSAPGAEELFGPDVTGFLCHSDSGVVRTTPLPALPPFTPAVAPLPAGAGAIAPLPTLRLAWLDPANVVGLGAAGARDEATRVFKAMGIPTSWRRAVAGEVAKAEEIRVILLDRGALNERNAIVLGATPSRFEDAPLVWVHVPNVCSALGLAERETAVLDPHDVHRLGVALGRVIAHEMVHALAPGLPHGRGLMASRLTRSDLTAYSLPVAAEVGPAVRAVLAGGPLGPRPGAGLLSLVHASDEPQR